MKIVTRIPMSVHQHWSQYGSMSYVFNYLVDHYDFMNAMHVEYPLDEKIKVTLTVTSDEYLRLREAIGERTPWLSPARILSYFKEIDVTVPPQGSSTSTSHLERAISELTLFVEEDPTYAKSVRDVIQTLRTIMRGYDDAEE